MQSRIYSVAEICDGKAKLIDENGDSIYLDLALIKYPVAEGDMLRFDAVSGTSPDGQLTRQRRREVMDKHRRITKRRR